MKRECLVLKKEDLKERPDMGENWYEWDGQGDGRDVVFDERFNVVISKGKTIDTKGGFLYTRGGHIDTRGGFIDAEVTAR